MWRFGTKNIKKGTVITAKEFIVSNNGEAYPLFVKSLHDNELQDTLLLPPGSYTFKKSQGANGYNTIITALDLLVYSEKNNSIINTIKLAENVEVDSNPAGHWNSDINIKVDLTEPAYILPKISTATAPLPVDELFGNILVSIESSNDIYSTNEETISLKWKREKSATGDLLLKLETSSNLKINNQTTRWAGNTGNIEVPLLPAGLYTIHKTIAHNFQNDVVEDVILVTDLVLSNNTVISYTKLATLWGNGIGDIYSPFATPIEYPLKAWSSLNKNNNMVNIFTLTEPKYVQILKLNNDVSKNFCDPDQLIEIYNIELNLKELQ